MSARDRTNSTIGMDARPHSTDWIQSKLAQFPLVCMVNYNFIQRYIILVKHYLVTLTHVYVQSALVSHSKGLTTTGKFSRLPQRHYFVRWILDCWTRIKIYTWIGFVTGSILFGCLKHHTIRAVQLDSCILQCSLLICNIELWFIWHW